MRRRRSSINGKGKEEQQEGGEAERWTRDRRKRIRKEQVKIRRRKSRRRMGQEEEVEKKILVIFKAVISILKFMGKLELHQDLNEVTSTPNKIFSQISFSFTNVCMFQKCGISDGFDGLRT